MLLRKKQRNRRRTIAVTTTNTEKVLVRTGYTDYKLQEGNTSCWVSVNNVSIYIQRTDEGVAVDLWPLGLEDRDLSISGAWLTFAEAQEDINEDAAKNIGA
jgi:hypothetical protein